MSEVENEITEFRPANPVAVFTDEKQYNEFYAKVKAECAKLVPDVTTAKGRKEIASMAFKVSRSKVALDKAGDSLLIEKRKEIDAVNASRNKIKAEFDELRDEVRKPLTEWEKAEAERETAVKDSFARWDAIEFHNLGKSADDIEIALEALKLEAIEESVYQDQLDEAVKRHDAAVARLEMALRNQCKAEADAKELEELRAKQAQRDEEDNRKAEQQRIKEEAEAEAKRQAEAEDKRKADEAERERKHQEEIAAERQRVADEAAAKAQADAEERQRKHDEELAAERAERKRVADEQQAKIDRLAAAEKKRLDDEAEQKRQDEARAKDKAHRSKLYGETKASLIALGCEEKLAHKIVLAIAAEAVANVEYKL